MWMLLPDSMKQSQADLFLETYQVLDLEMSRLREILRWQGSAASKDIVFYLQLAADMQRFSRPERCINGPTKTYRCSPPHGIIREPSGLSGETGRKERTNKPEEGSWGEEGRVYRCFGEFVSSDYNSGGRSSEQEVLDRCFGGKQVIDLEERENIKPESAAKDDVLGDEELNASWTPAFETYNGRSITYTDCAGLSSSVAYRILREGSLLRDVKEALKEVVKLIGEIALPNTWCCAPALVELASAPCFGEQVLRSRRGLALGQVSERSLSEHWMAWGWIVSRGLEKGRVSLGQSFESPNDLLGRDDLVGNAPKGGWPLGGQVPEVVIKQSL
ncbi:hypothetical protein RHGRI_014826 [Rhododendron griersonianum]|uniref:Uncharacterized protein n=1 Tax=Rhododendron griersonianum TaxID=479676 RepID=A0AAV6KBH4_9ERIC|nr:hypothetical protein RHGRI_014826 [Rhododendron griersonianum]